MKSHFVMLAEYNEWANARLYGMAKALPDELYRKDVGVYFKSVHGTLNHILVADLVWMYRMTGDGDLPTKLNAIVHDDLPSLTATRHKEDRRIKAFVETLSDAQLQSIWSDSVRAPSIAEQPLLEILTHLFNHQTHHRGQLHAALTILGVAEPEPLDFLAMYRRR